MTTNDITLDDARLAEIEKAARGSWSISPWVYDIDSAKVFVRCGWGTALFVAKVGDEESASHIVATQPRVALALVAEIRRLRDIIETIRALRGEEGGVS